MRRWRVLALFVIVVVAVGTVPAGARQVDDPVVHGVLFFSPSCGYCEYVIQEVLPPLFEENGGPWELVREESAPVGEAAYYLLTNGTLELLLVDVTVVAGAEFFQTATEAFAIDSTGVPRLIVANQVMVGATDIPARFPGLVEDGLEADGIDWPDLPGVADIVESLEIGPSPTTTPSTATVGSTEATPASTTTTTVAATTTTAASGAFPPVGDGEDRGFGDDAVANSIAVVVLLALLAGLVATAVLVRRRDVPYRPGGLIPFLVLAGLVVASYLTFVEMAGSEAVCGPVGDCNVVQESEYATVAGIPIGIIGLIGYLLIGALWVLQRSGPARRIDLARVGMALVTVGGVAFTAWLTFLEPFVIHATCAWCLGSAVVIGALMWLTVPPGIAAWRRVAPGSDVEELAA